MIHLLGCLSLLGYLALAHLSANGSPARVAWALAVWGLLFLPFAWLAKRALKVPEPQRAALGTELSTGTGLSTSTGLSTQIPTKAILAWALLFRIALLPAGLPTQDPLEHLRLDLRLDPGGEEAGYQPFLLWDNDVWRYLWEGHVVANGLSPYRLSPGEILAAADDGEEWAENLVEEGPWLDILDRISYLDHRSVYPPLALALFRIGHGLIPGSVLTWKVVLTGLEFTGCVLFALLLKRAGGRPELALLLAWNPLLIKEVAGSGHIDGALVTLLVASLLFHAMRRPTLAISTLTAAILVKLWPVLFAPALLLRSRWKAWWPLPLGLTLAYWPYRHDLGELALAFRAFSAEWVFNPGPWFLVEKISHFFGTSGRAAPDLLHVTLTLSAVAITAWRHLLRTRKLPRAHTIRSNPEGLSPEGLSNDWFLIGSIFVLFSATVMPWYLVALLPMAALLRSWPWLVATAAVILSYGIYLDGKEHAWVLIIEFSIIAAAFLWAGTQHHLGSHQTPKDPSLLSSP